VTHERIHFLKAKTVGLFCFVGSLTFHAVFALKLATFGLLYAMFIYLRTCMSSWDVHLLFINTVSHTVRRISDGVLSDAGWSGHNGNPFHTTTSDASSSCIFTDTVGGDPERRSQRDTNVHQPRQAHTTLLCSHQFHVTLATVLKVRTERPK